MNPFSYYLIKMAICSAVLTGYYYVDLRNKRFHRWNRLYLLSSVVFSMAVPFLRIPLDTASESLVSVLSRSEHMMLGGGAAAESAYMHRSGFDFPWFAALYGLGTCLVLAAILKSLFTIASLKRNAVRKKLPEAVLYITESEAAPFSFFRNIFWRRNISPDTAEGRCVLRHELHHVKSKHSWDKAFMQVVLCLLWVNPVFWLIRRELDMIHEFEADSASVKDNDTSVLAAMILCTVYPHRELAGINQFFKSPVKRRLSMLARSHCASLAYVRRLLALPVAALVFALWVFRAEAVPYSEINPSRDKNPILLNDMDGNGLIQYRSVSDTLKGNKRTITTKTKDSTVIIHQYFDESGSRIKSSTKQVILPDTLNRGNKRTITTKTKDSTVIIHQYFDESGSRIKSSTKQVILSDTLNQKKIHNVISLVDSTMMIRPYRHIKHANANERPLFIIDGKSVDPEEFEAISADSVFSFSILKEHSAIARYGEKGRKGVIEVTTKRGKAQEK